jgi:hypothetical protein
MPKVEEIEAKLSGKLDGAVSVVVARRGVEDGLDARKLSLADNAAAAFRELCRDVVESLPTRSAVAYNSDAELKSDQVFVLEDAETLSELSDLQGLATLASTLPDMPPAELDLSIQLYAVVVGTAKRAVFVRRVDPQIRPRGGGFFAVGKNRLRRLEQPAFSFTPGFDLILTDDWALVLNQGSFERLFRDIGLVERHVAEWVEGITDHLPMADASVTDLRDVALRDSRTWRKLREIRRRGHLASVDLADVRRYAKKMGLDPSKVVQGNQLIFEPSERFSFLHLLNEDLYKGPLTDATFEAQRKSPTGT